MAKLEIALLVGHESKEFLAKLEEQLDRLEKLQGILPTKNKLKESAPDEEEPEEDDEEEIAPAPKRRGRPPKVKTPEFDEDEEDEEEKEEKVEEEDEEEDEDLDEDDDTDSFDDEEEKEEEAEEEDDEEELPKTKGKAKKYTIEDVNEACKAKAKAEGTRDGVLNILKKKFGTQSVKELKKEQYEECIRLMTVKK